MRSLLRLIGRAIVAQPFYSDEIGMLKLTFETWRGTLPAIGGWQWTSLRKSFEL